MPVVILKAGSNLSTLTDHLATSVGAPCLLPDPSHFSWFWGLAVLLMLQCSTSSSQIPPPLCGLGFEQSVPVASLKACPWANGMTFSLRSRKPWEYVSPPESPVTGGWKRSSLLSRWCWHWGVISTPELFGQAGAGLPPRSHPLPRHPAYFPTPCDLSWEHRLPNHVCKNLISGPLPGTRLKTIWLWSSSNTSGETELTWADRIPCQEWDSGNLCGLKNP